MIFIWPDVSGLDFGHVTEEQVENHFFQYLTQKGFEGPKVVATLVFQKMDRKVYDIIFSIEGINKPEALDEMRNRFSILTPEEYIHENWSRLTPESIKILEGIQ